VKICPLGYLICTDSTLELQPTFSYPSGIIPASEYENKFNTIYIVRNARNRKFTNTPHSIKIIRAATAALITREKHAI